MTDIQIREFLSQIQLFSGLSDTELSIFSGAFHVKNYKTGDHLFKQNTNREAIFVIFMGEVELYLRQPHGEEKRIAYFDRYDFLGEGALLDNSPHSTNARAMSDVTILEITRKDFVPVFEKHPNIAINILKSLSTVVQRRMHNANAQLVNAGAQYVTSRTRLENDLLGDREVPDHAYYGVQTLRATENFNISGVTLQYYPALIQSLAIVKMGAARANYDLGLLTKEVADAICYACDEIMKGKYHRHFVVDMIQGGAGTSTNMNANEVIANRALEILGHNKGEYKYCSPNDHVNLSQSTNDAYPTAIKIALLYSNIKFVEVLKDLIDSFRRKAVEFKDVIKMGRTQLQDAVPMTLGQAFEAYAVTLEEEVERLEGNVLLFTEINMGATAIGTGINADPEYGGIVLDHLRKITGFDLKMAKNLIEATQDTGAFIMYSSAVKRLAVKLSKICNDLRLISSGPRTGINEINLPPMQPGSSIMPGKVNPVIPEVVNQIAFKVIGNDLSVTLASEAGQLELNVMEPLIVQSLMENIEMLKNGMDTLRYRCIDGITANVEHCRQMVHNSIGLVTALNPIIGYKASTKLAKQALEENRSVYDLVLENKLMSKEELDNALAPENMLKPRKMTGQK
jgi:aspartate ammonia-lyase